MTFRQFVQVSIDDCDRCQHHQWYPHFKSHAFKSVQLETPSQLVEWLKSDGILLPDDNSMFTRQPIEEHEDYDDDGWEQELATATDDNDVSTNSVCADAQLPAAFVAQINDVIENQLGGTAFVKLNWSSPRDATWLMGFDRTLKFTSADQVLSALKASDFIMHDIEHRYELCHDYNVDNQQASQHQTYMVLKKWKPLKPAQEFRCFIFENKLIGACQRYPNAFYEYLVQEQASILNSLERLIEAMLKDNQFALKSYVLDVYLTSSSKLKVLDVNPFGEMTDSTLFTWDELAALCQNHSIFAENKQKQPEIELRIIESEQGIRPSLLSISGLPYDLTLGATTATSSEADSLVEQIRAAAAQQAQEPS